MPVESYMHKYAKTVLASWLRKKLRIGEKYKGLENIPLRFSKNALLPWMFILSIRCALTREQNKL